MNAAENNLIQLLTGKPSLQDVMVNELEEVTGKYPYFSLGQFFLTKKVKQSKPKDFTKQLQYCAIYFQDIAWLQGEMYNIEHSTTSLSEDDTVQATTSFKATIERTEVIESNVTNSKYEANNVENNNHITLPAEDVLKNFTLEMNDVKDEPELPPLDEEELATANDAATEATAKIADVLQHQVEDFKAPIDEESDLPISTEPYHTVDYFASQGIKVDTQAPDAFTKKVHTFTDWLKQMKRISNYPTDLGSDPEMESFVQSIADTSNQSKAVDTEAMAEVLVKQGKLDKAIEVYQNLSLLNPHKTAYFAAKINYLKGI
jgi:hypothetical protein